MRQVSRLWLLVVLVALLSGCGYNAIQQKDEAVKAGWSEVLNQYKRRADLIPNLVKTVQGYAQQERHNRNEQNENHEVIDGYLHQGMRRVATREVTPHEHHRRTWRSS